MREPSLQKTTAVSAALHLTVFIVTFLVLRHSSHNVLPSPYMVSLVGPGRERVEAGTPAAKAATPPAETAVKERPAKRETTVDQKRVEERISELRAKKNIERLNTLRKIVSVRGKETSAGSTQQQKTASAGALKGTSTGVPGATGNDSYVAKITEEIHEHWVWPSAGGKGLEAIIEVKIERDGTIKILGTEKRSGNSLFDRFALKALRDASPVSPPSQEMEIGIRFYP